jgi:two-component system, LytTR family, response regulator AlgR
MNALRVLLVDDESLARARMRSLLMNYVQPPAQVVCEASSVLTAKVWLAEHDCDVVLLDIAMPGASGLELAAELQLRPGAPLVVFVTAHPEHALQAFDLAAVDYLTKPVRADRLQAALARAAQRQRQNASSAVSPPAQDSSAGVATQKPAPFIVVIDRGRTLRVPVSEVLYFKAELKYVTMRTATHSHVIDDALSDLEHRVGPDFIRVHRNALVAKKAIRALEKNAQAGQAQDDTLATWTVRVAPTDECLGVSRRQVAAVREALVIEGL